MNPHINDAATALMLIAIAVLAATVAGLIAAMLARAAGSSRWAAALTGGASFSAAMTLMLALADTIRGLL
jgi:Kef-type K+ transport system membrane component KefB